MRLDRGTVATVLSQPEIQQAIEGFRAELIGLFPKATRAIVTALDNGDGHLGLKLAERMGATLAPENGERQPVVLNITVDRRSRPVEIPKIPLQACGESVAPPHVVGGDFVPHFVPPPHRENEILGFESAPGKLVHVLVHILVENHRRL